MPWHRLWSVQIYIDSFIVCFMHQFERKSGQFTTYISSAITTANIQHSEYNDFSHENKIARMCVRGNKAQCF